MKKHYDSNTKQQPSSAEQNGEMNINITDSVESYVSGGNIFLAHEVCKDCPHPLPGPKPWFIAALLGVLVFILATLVVVDSIENKHIQDLQHEVNELRGSLNNSTLNNVIEV